MVAAVVLVWWVLRPVVDWVTTTYTFTNRRFIKRSGLIAKEGRTIPLNRISGVDFEIGVIDRIFGCGTLIVSDASTNGRVLLETSRGSSRCSCKVSEELHTLAGAAPAPTMAPERRRRGVRRRRTGDRARAPRPRGPGRAAHPDRRRGGRRRPA